MKIIKKWFPCNDQKLRKELCKYSQFLKDSKKYHLSIYVNSLLLYGLTLYSFMDKCYIVDGDELIIKFKPSNYTVIVSWNLDVGTNFERQIRRFIYEMEMAKLYGRFISYHEFICGCIRELYAGKLEGKTYIGTTKNGRSNCKSSN